MNSIMIFVQTVLEILSVYFLLTAIDKSNRIHKIKLAVLLSVGGIAAVITDYMLLSYHLLVLLAVTAVCLRIFTGNPWKNIISDWVMSIVVLFCFQFAVILILSIFIKNVTEIGAVAFAVLIAENIVMYLLARFDILNNFLERYYRNNRDIVFLAMAALIILAVLVTDVWDDKQTNFWKHRIELLVLTVMYVALNMLLMLSFYKHIKEKHQIKLKEEHELYLTRIADEMAQREHEYKNHLNAIIGIANYNKEDPLGAIISYSNEILKRERDKELLSPISDNMNIASFVNHEAHMAENRGIDFEYYTERPFPEYKIPDVILVEILSNLLNNAFEAAEAVENGKGNVYLGIESEKIVIRNSFEEIPDVKNMKKEGYSRKGRGRGYGMSVVLKNCRKYNIKLETYIQGEYMFAELNMIKAEQPLPM